MGQNTGDDLRHYLCAVAALGGDVDVHPVARLSHQRLGREVGCQAVSHRHGIDDSLKGHGVIRRRQGIGIAKVDLVLPGALLMVRALRPYPHLLQRQADLPPHILALVLRRDVHVPCVVVGDVGRFTVFVPAEEIELHLRAEGETDAQCFRVRHRLTQQRAAVGLEGGAIGPQHVAEHPRHSAVIRPPGQHTEGAAVRMQEQVRVDLVAEAGHSGGIESDAVAEGPVQLIRQNRYIFLAAENIAEGQTQEFYILLRRKLPDLIHCVLHCAPAFLSWLHTSADRGFCCPV